MNPATPTQKEQTIASHQSRKPPIKLRDFLNHDLPFLYEMLYEAVFWRKQPNTPSLKAGLDLPELRRSLEDWSNRSGDTAVIAVTEDLPVGAAWFRYWTDDNHINGYVNKHTPAAVLAVHHHYRRNGIGKALMERLIQQAGAQSIPRISLSVSKDNHALNLYQQLDFKTVEDKGDMLLMVRQIP